jgi:hypothetical protein
MHFEILRFWDLAPALVHAWDRLAAGRGMHADLYSSHAWLVAWVQAMGAEVAGALRIPAVLGPDRPVALLPLVARSPRRGEWAGKGGSRMHYRPVLAAEQPPAEETAYVRWLRWHATAADFGPAFGYPLGGESAATLDAPRLSMEIGALDLELGGRIEAVTVAYRTWGRLNAAGDNAVLVLHALTGDTLAAGPGGWWEPLDPAPQQAVDRVGEAAERGRDRVVDPERPAPRAQQLLDRARGEIEPAEAVGLVDLHPAVARDLDREVAWDREHGGGALVRVDAQQPAVLHAGDDPAGGIDHHVLGTGAVQLQQPHRRQRQRPAARLRPGGCGWRLPDDRTQWGMAHDAHSRS